MNGIYVNILGIIIIAVGTGVMFLGVRMITNEDNKSLNKDLQRIKEELAIKDEEIKNLTKIAVLSTTGGNSFCVLSFANCPQLDPNPNVMSITIGNAGDFPMYDVNVRITDLDTLKQDIPFEESLKKEININAGNIAPHALQFIGHKFALGTGGEKKYNIFISARNGSFTQYLRFKRISPDYWQQASRVFIDTAQGRKVLYEDIDAGFPRDEKGEVAWE